VGEAGFDLSLTGFDEFELGELFAERTQGRTDPDDAPEPPAHPVAEPGDLWGARPSSIALRRQHSGDRRCACARRQSASGVGRSWKWKAIGTVPLPPSFRKNCAGRSTGAQGRTDPDDAPVSLVFLLYQKGSRPRDRGFHVESVLFARILIFDHHFDVLRHDGVKI
jgi:hypothetical protein